MNVSPPPVLRSLPLALIASLALLLGGCGGAPKVHHASHPAPALPGAASEPVAGGTSVATPAPPEAPELQSSDGKVESQPGEPMVVLQNPPRGNDLGGFLGTPTGPTLVVHYTDVGQGDGIVIQTPGGKTIVVDTGPPPGCNRFIRYLGDLEVHHIDLLINTHPHADHLGCSAAVMREVSVGNVFESGFENPTPEYETMLKQMQADKIPLKIARRGRNVNIETDVALEVLAPDEPLIQGSRSDPNANSVVFRLVYKKVSFLFVGDAEEETEERLMRGDREKLRADVLKVAHHGSAYASSSEFLSAVHPRLAVISYGRNNVYGHPAPATLQRLSAVGAQVLKTAQDGNIVMVTDGTAMQVWTVPRYGGPFGGARLWYPGRPAPREVSLTPGSEAVAAARKIDLNHATVDELVRLPTIGQKIAEKIVEERNANGRFNAVDDLRRVKGIGPAKLERLRPYVLCGPGAAAPEPAVPESAAPPSMP